MNIEIELQQTPKKQPQQKQSIKKTRQLNNVKVEYYNYDIGFSWRRLFSWNNENQSFDRSKQPKHSENKKKK